MGVWRERKIKYLILFSEDEHKKIMDAADWLFKNGYIKSKSKLNIGRYALLTLVSIVEKKKALGDKVGKKEEEGSN